LRAEGMVLGWRRGEKDIRGRKEEGGDDSYRSYTRMMDTSIFSMIMHRDNVRRLGRFATQKDA
jgi:hypothetical protein